MKIRLKYLVNLYHFKLILWLHEQLWFRKWIGGSWFYVCDVGSGEEYWVRDTPNIWLAVIINEEHW